MNQNSTSPSMFDDVVEFHTKVLQLSTPTEISLHSPAWILERYRFLHEEAAEFYDNAHVGDMVGAVDGLLDSVYVALGTLYIMGLTAEQVKACWAAVQKANLAKVPGRTKRGNLVDAAKPANWVGPEAEIAKVIAGALDAKTES